MDSRSEATTAGGDAACATPDGLVGATGFVGSSLLRQARFGACFDSRNIETIRGARFRTLVCAGAPALKWRANADPATDRAGIERLAACLERAECDRFVLVSTVDVFRDPVGIDETSPVEERGLHAYGLNRRWLERFVMRRFARCLVIRLPGLVGAGLRKNALYDLRHAHQVDALDARAVFQFYPVDRLWRDIGIAGAAGLELVHLTAEPVSLARVAAECFGRVLPMREGGSPARYDMRTLHASRYGAAGHYQVSLGDSLRAVRAYASAAIGGAETVAG